MRTYQNGQTKNLFAKAMVNAVLLFCKPIRKIFYEYNS